MPERPLFGLDKERMEEVRITGPFVGLWFAVFALPLFLMVRETPAPFSPARAVRGGLKSLWSTLRLLPHHKQTGQRSEEHTSELQSLMRISYAVFCLKKQKNSTQQTTI